MHWNDLPVRRATAIVVSAAALYLSVLALVSGFFLSAGMCAFGGCSEPDNPDLGGLLMLSAPVLLFGGLALAARLSRASYRALRVIGAVPLGLLVGVVVAQLLPGTAPWLEILVLHAVVVTAIAVVVPPTGPPWWAAAVIGGGLSVGVLPLVDGMPYGILLGIAPLVVAELAPSLARAYDDAVHTTTVGSS